MEAKELDLAYYAGLFDGEGCIHIGKTHVKKGGLLYQLACKIAMYNLPVLEEFKSHFGGSIRHDKKDPIHNKYGLLVTWTIYSSRATTFLSQIMPHLRIKKPQAELAIQFQANKHWGARKGCHRNPPKTEERLAIEEAQYILMRNLKKEFSHA